MPHSCKWMHYLQDGKEFWECVLCHTKKYEEPNTSKRVDELYASAIDAMEGYAASE